MPSLPLCVQKPTLAADRQCSIFHSPPRVRARADEKVAPSAVLNKSVRHFMSSPASTLSAGTTLDWGRTAYSTAWKRQEELVTRRNQGDIGDTLIFTEHE